MRRVVVSSLAVVGGAIIGVSLATSSLAVANSGTPDEPSNGSQPDELTPAPAPLGAGATDELDTCFWVRDLSDSEIVRVECETDQRVISGGCLSDKAGVEVEGSFAFEGTIAGSLDLPDANEPWYSVASLSGWYCEFSGMADATTANYVYALCCGS